MGVILKEKNNGNKYHIEINITDNGDPYLKIIEKIEDEEKYYEEFIFS